MKFDKIVLVDLDNLNSQFHLDVICTLYTPKTKFVFFGNAPQLKSRIDIIKNRFWFLKHQLSNETEKTLYTDQADVRLVSYVRDNIQQWVHDGVKDLVVATNDNFAICVCISIRNFVQNVWLVHSCTSAMLRTAKKLGQSVPTIRIKDDEQCSLSF